MPGLPEEKNAHSSEVHKSLLNIIRRLKVRGERCVLCGMIIFVCGERENTVIIIVKEVSSLRFVLGEYCVLACHHHFLEKRIHLVCWGYILCE